MKITKLIISNFRCFGPEPTEITLGDLTAFVGGNGTGKTAVQAALVKLFASSESDRRLCRSDFHNPCVPGGTEPDKIRLFIEAYIEFSELSEDLPAEDAGISRVRAAAECFQQMGIQEPGGPLYAIIRLSAQWLRTEHVEGDVEQKLVWGKQGEPPGGIPGDENGLLVKQYDRTRIQVVYVPAVRDPLRQLRSAAGSEFHRLLGAIPWSPAARAAVGNASAMARQAFAEEPGVAMIQATLQEVWSTLRTEAHCRNVALQPVAKDLEDLLKRIEATLSPGPAGGIQNVEDVSDGLRSLFYLAIVAAAFDLEEAVLHAEDVDEHNGGDAPINVSRLDPPLLRILAIEEAENHLAPHLLGRITRLLRKIANSPRGQVLLSSHSASILSRVEPQEVRNVRATGEGRSMVKSILLPPGEAEAGKYVREAVRAHPELYFARAVVLGEGDSEEVVIPRIVEAFGLELDPNLVSFVPLGGRHVNHFWRLLSDLGIPHVTLLDLDRERDGGGDGRYHYVLSELLVLKRASGQPLTIGRSEFTEENIGMVKGIEGESEKKLLKWLSKNHGVFFSAPLDLDFSMLKAFPEEYKATRGALPGPQIPDPAEDSDAHSRRIESAIRAVLKDNGGDGRSYERPEVELFPWYSYFFLGRQGKPTTHQLAMASLPSERLKAEAPEELKQLAEAIIAMVAPEPLEGSNAGS